MSCVLFTARDVTRTLIAGGGGGVYLKKNQFEKKLVGQNMNI